MNSGQDTQQGAQQGAQQDIQQASQQDTQQDAKQDAAASEYVYLDYAASAPFCEEALLAMRPHLQTGNPSVLSGMNPNSLSRPGRDAFRELEKARKDVMASIGARRPDEIIFTSGATEADNAALFGLAYAQNKPNPAQAIIQKTAKRPRIITSAIEHDAVLKASKRLSQDGFEVTYLMPDRDGFIDVSSLENEIDDDVCVVSVQLANSETGAIQPIKQLAELAHKHGAMFHTDATQALGKIHVCVQELGVDAASFSSHKVGGPAGVGALYLKANTNFRSMILGGGQESGRRSGTQNVCGAVGFAAACKATCCMQETEHARLIKLRDELYSGLSAFESIEATCEVEEGSFDYLPNIVNVMFSGIESQTLVLRFDKLGFAVSGASACASHSLDPSHVLTSMGITPDKAQCELRVSFGRYTTKDDIDKFLLAVPHVLDWGN